MSLIKYYYNGSLNWSTLNVFPFNILKDYLVLNDILNTFASSKILCKFVKVDSGLIVQLKETRVLENYHVINYMSDTDLFLEVNHNKIEQFCKVLVNYKFAELVAISTIKNISFYKFIKDFNEIKGQYIAENCSFSLCYNAKNNNGLYAMLNLNCITEADVKNSIKKLENKFKN